MKTAAVSARTISLNSDIGEGFGAWSIADDAALLTIITDANVACGFHAGDPDIMRTTCLQANQAGITVGAQVGYWDLRGFGRRFMAVDPKTIVNDVLYQLGALSAFTRAAGTEIRYLKVHGALYHAAVAHSPYAEAIIDALGHFDPDLPLLCQPGTPLARTAESAGRRIIREGYVDRAYTAEGLLAPRDEAGSVFNDPAVCAEQAVSLAMRGQVVSKDGSTVTVAVDSLCIHSDSPGAPNLARAVRRALQNAGATLTPLGS